MKTFHPMYHSGWERKGGNNELVGLPVDSRLRGNDGIHELM